MTSCWGGQAATAGGSMRQEKTGKKDLAEGGEDQCGDGSSHNSESL